MLAAGWLLLEVGEDDDDGDIAGEGESGADGSPKRIGHDMPVRQGCRKITGDFGNLGASLVVMCQPPHYMCPPATPREGGDNSSGLRSGSGAEMEIDKGIQAIGNPSFLTGPGWMQWAGWLVAVWPDGLGRGF